MNSLFRDRPRRALLLFLVALTSWIFWLRAPTFHVPLWNVDEGIHAVVAGRLLEGHVMYRDIADHRTPLSYYAVAMLFRFTGTSMTALHLTVAAMIAATAAGLFFVGRRLGGTATGLGAALIFAGLSSYLLVPSDAYAAHTEWFLALFTTAAALVFQVGSAPPSALRAALTGGLFGLAFLSKQPALVDLGAPLATIFYLALLRGWTWRESLRSGLALLAGWALVVGLVAVVFIAAGAWRDLAFYAWTYNTRYYGPEVTWGDRLLAPLPFFTHLVATYPFVAVAGLLGTVVAALRLAQLPPAGAPSATRGPEAYVLVWAATSLAGAMASGRSFDHYFIQFLPAFALIAAWAPARLIAWTRARPAGPVCRGLALAAAAALALSVVWIARAARATPLPPADPALPLSAFIRAHSQPGEKIFVWGYNPDIHLYSERPPATRFLYCTFQTGLIPWTNLDPARDTAYAIVPGSMDALLGDLRDTPPVFIVDCGVGPHRRFSKYPLQNFAPLRAFVAAHYVEVDPERYRAQGFRLFLRRDSAHPAPTDLTSTADARHPAPGVQGPNAVGTEATRFFVGVEDPQGGATLCRLALLVDGAESAAVRFPPAAGMRFAADITLEPGGTNRHQLVALAEWSDGTRTLGTPAVVTVSPLSASAAQSRAFALPRLSGAVPATGVRALLNPNANESDGTREFALHAPSLLRYSLPAGALALRGRYGLPAGAYAAENKFPSDGAQFIVRVTTPDGRVRVLLDRLLQPAREPADRPVQNFRLLLDNPPAGSVLELEIGPGPGGSASSDWTFWSDVVLETSA